MIESSKNRSAWGSLLLLLALGLCASTAYGGEEASEGDEAPPPEDSDKKPAAKKSKVPMRKVLEHKKQFVIYPRVGYTKVIGGGEEVPAVDHGSIGFDLQIGLKQKFFLSVESHLLYITGGEYGLNYSQRFGTIERYGEKNFTSLTGVGFGMFTKLLDGQELWTHVGIKAGYLYPFYLPIWLGGDIEKEFRRTRGSYWVISAAPMAGILIPIKNPVVKDSYEPVDPTVLAPDSGSMKLRFMFGVQTSIAFIFAPRS